MGESPPQTAPRTPSRVHRSPESSGNCLLKIRRIIAKALRAGLSPPNFLHQTTSKGGVQL